jgi:serine/threonine protein kinase
MEHQIFVEFFGWFEDKENVYLAMEYFPLGTLDNFINDRLSEDDTRKISLQLLEGLCIMHEEGFTHRDLKPQVSICSAHFAHPCDYISDA